MKTTVLTSGLILALLSGCHQPVSQQNSAASAATTEDDYLQRINRLPQKQRDAVFYRAIDDAGFDCRDILYIFTYSDLQHVQRGNVSD